MVDLLDRVELDGAFGTVKYIGSLPNWGDDVTAYGIEWDDPQRGKNNGTLGNTRYFSVDKPNSGSFVKASNKKLRFGRSFVEAVLEKYAGDENVSALKREIVFGSKKVESIGFERLNRQQATLEALESVSCEKTMVQFAGDVEKLPLMEKVKHLDLSYNLLVDMGELKKITEKMPRLRSLNLNGSQLRTFGAQIVSVEELDVASCGISEENLGKLLRSFPNLRRLCVAGNKLKSFKIDFSASLRSIDLSYNELSELPVLPVEELSAANNQITRLPRRASPTRILDLRDNPILSWKEIDMVAESFPDLEELRIDGCKVFDQLSIDEMTAMLVGRLSCSSHRGQGISKLNGSDLRTDEIRNSELYIVSKAQKGQIEVLSQNRWEQLSKKYNLEKKATTPQRHPDRFLLTMRTSSGDLMFSRVFLSTNTVLRLKGIVTRHTGVPVHRFNLYYYPSDIRLDDDVSKTILDDDIATLASTGLDNECCIYYEPHMI
ncbi:hypothetical_protein [Candidozyma auris]|uniref:hypothetical_protein n=1 Tax=Candidozyma auris TaxID=498019 RepID=UPI000D28762C|nr:hypothetical_protein [[Candida] auris]QEO22328.1 hypothetical_protein [[Candida] auris]